MFPGGGGLLRLGFLVQHFAEPAPGLRVVRVEGDSALVLLLGGGKLAVSFRGDALVVGFRGVFGDVEGGDGDGGPFGIAELL